MAAPNATPGPARPGRLTRRRGRDPGPARAAGPVEAWSGPGGTAGRTHHVWVGRPDRPGGVVGLHVERLAQRVGELAAAAVPVVGLLGHHLGYHLVHGLRQVRPHRGHPRRRRGQVRVEHRHRHLAPERHRAGQQRVRHAPEGVLVRPAVHVPPADLLGRRVVGRAEELPGLGQPARRHHAPGQPEVGQVHVRRAAGRGVDQDVPRLDVTVHQAGGVRGVQGRGHRGDDRRRPVRPQPALPFDDHPQVVAGHEAHRDEQHAARLARVVDGDDVRVVHRRDRACLAGEPPLHQVVPGQQLQRHHPAEPLVAGPVHRRHPAHADQLLEPVPGHAGTRSQPGQQATELTSGESPATTPPHDRAPYLAAQTSSRQSVIRRLSSRAAGAARGRSGAPPMDEGAWPAQGRGPWQR